MQFVDISDKRRDAYRPNRFMRRRKFWHAQYWFLYFQKLANAHGLHEKLLRRNRQQPADQQQPVVSYTNKEWNELIAEGLLFPFTVPAAGVAADGFPGANYVPDVRDTMHNYPGAASMASPPARIDDRDRSDHSARGRKRARGQNSVSKSSPTQDTRYRLHEPGMHRPILIPVQLRKNHRCQLCYRLKQYDCPGKPGKPVPKKHGKPVRAVAQQRCEFCKKTFCFECFTIWHDSEAVFEAAVEAAV